jgi:hypothetical protein
MFRFVSLAVVICLRSDSGSVGGQMESDSLFVKQCTVVIERVMQDIVERTASKNKNKTQKEEEQVILQGDVT